MRVSMFKLAGAFINTGGSAQSALPRVGKLEPSGFKLLRDGMAAAIVTQWLMKSLYEASATPLLYAAVRFLKKKEGIDHYDRDTNFNPLKFLPADQ